MTDRIQNEIEALKSLAIEVPDDAIAQASIAAQISALEWADIAVPPAKRLSEK